MSNWYLVEFNELYSEAGSRNGLTRPKRVRGQGYKMVNMGELFAYDRIDNQPMERVPMDESEIAWFALERGDFCSLVSLSNSKEQVNAPSY